MMRTDLAKKFKEFQKTQKNYNHRDDNVLLIDGTNTFFRCFGANQAQNDDGYHVGGYLGFLYSIGIGVRISMPTRMVVVFDGRGGSKKRKKIYEGYKSGRSFKTKPSRVPGFEDLEDYEESLKRQFGRLIEYLDYLPVTLIKIDYIEADDVIAYMSKQVFDKEVTIFSSDKDYLQLIDDRINVYSPTKKKHYDVKKFQEEYKVLPENYIHIKCIEGDASDSVPGIKGIGKKTIEKKLDFLFKDEVYNLEEFYKKIEELYKETEDNTYKKLLDKKDEYIRNYKLMQLFEVDISGNHKTNIRNIVRDNIQEMDVKKFFELCNIDKLSTTFSNPVLWLQQNFAKIDRFRNKK